MPDYQPPVSQLLRHGDAEFGYQQPWPDYPARYGLGPEHVPELIRMATDPDLYEPDPDLPGDEAEDRFYATVHARRALGLLRAAEAAAPLIRGMEEFSEFDDYWTEELPKILGMIGPPAIDRAAETIPDPDRELWTRVACATGLAQIAQNHPESRDRCVTILNDCLARHLDGEDDQIVNGDVVAALMDLEAVESAEVIEQAFEAGAVDESIAGDWPIVRFELGLGPKPEGYRTAAEIERMMRVQNREPRPRRPDLAKLKKKRKLQQKARKRSRKRR